MDARTSLSLQVTAFAAFLLLPLTIHAAGSARTQNFVVTAPTQALAREIANSAERYRRDLAISWLGKELPPWQDPCPVRANVDRRLGAGGATSFLFETYSRQFARPVGDGLFRSQPAGRPYGWEMSLQGSRERVLDSVLPHEITHTIFATHFGRPLPRWADEGACTTVEHESEKAKQHRMLYEFLTTERGIPFNRMFSMTEYPKDILPLYSQGFSLARYLIQQGGRRKFVEYVGDGLNSNNWTEATHKHYGFDSISDLQVTWLDWVRNGSRTLPAGKPSPLPVQIASHTDQPMKVSNASDTSHSLPRATAQGTQSVWTMVASNESIGSARTSNNVQVASDRAGNGKGSSSTNSWYARQKTRPRDRLAARTSSRSARTQSRRRVSSSDQQEKIRVATRPSAGDVQREVMKEWGTPSEFLNPRLNE